MPVRTHVTKIVASSRTSQRRSPWRYDVFVGADLESATTDGPFRYQPPAIIDLGTLESLTQGLVVPGDDSLQLGLSAFDPPSLPL